MKRTLLSLLSILFLIALTLLTLHFLSKKDFLLAQEASVSPWRPIVRGLGMAATMIAGILSSLLAERVTSATTIDIRQELKGVLKSGQFLMAVVVAPIVFNAFYASISEAPRGLPDFMLAYQNGFFWQSVLERVRQANPSSGKAPPEPTKH
jgi:uncharacterized membrane protein YeaQ/YmgE (transglycosylase-associated protein family)